MGQYYNAVLEIKGNKSIYYHRVDNEYMAAKLMEHSYWGNAFVLAIASKFWRKKGRLAWVGDYAEPSDFNWKDTFEDAHSDKAKLTLKYNGFRLENKLLINHTKKMIIDLDDYLSLIKEKSNDMVINPLPLLTAVGNDKGGGDFHSGTGYDLVGSWTWDIIEITDDDEKYYNFKYIGHGEWNKIPKTDYIDVTKDYLFIEE